MHTHGIGRETPCLEVPALKPVACFHFPKDGYKVALSFRERSWIFNIYSNRWDVATWNFT